MNVQEPARVCHSLYENICENKSAVIIGIVGVIFLGLGIYAQSMTPGFMFNYVLMTSGSGMILCALFRFYVYSSCCSGKKEALSLKEPIHSHPFKLESEYYPDKISEIKKPSGDLLETFRAEKSAILKWQNEFGKMTIGIAYEEFQGEKLVGYGVYTFEQQKDRWIITDQYKQNDQEDYQTTVTSPNCNTLFLSFGLSNESGAYARIVLENANTYESWGHHLKGHVLQSICTQKYLTVD